MDTAYVILTYNGGDMPINLVDNIAKVEPAPIIVVDNGSKVSYRKYLIEELSQRDFLVVRQGERIDKSVLKGKNILLILSRNKLYAGGVYAGLKFAYEVGYSFAIMTNDDISIEKPFLKDSLMYLTENPEVAILGVNVLHRIDEDEWMFFDKDYYYDISSWQYVLWRFLSFTFGWKVAETFRKVFPFPKSEWVTGAFFIARLEAMREIDFFPKRMYMGAEEIQVAWHLKQKGYAITTKKYGLVRHYIGLTSGGGIKYLLGDIEFMYQEHVPFYKVKGGILKMVYYLYNIGLVPAYWIHKFRKRGMNL